MTTDTPPPLVPKLRFPEFADHGPWEAKPLDDLCDRLTETVGEAQLTPVSISAGQGFVPQAEKFGRDISGSQYGKYIWLHHGDFAYNRGNSKQFPQGCVYQLTEFDEAAASNAFHCFRLHDHCEPSFFLGFFENNGHGRQLVRHITSGARSNGLLNISADTFFGITIPIPRTPAEQQKIADCLGSLDDLIAAEDRKREALRRHKQGLMQQIFPQPGETVPRLRFPEVEKAGGWKNVTLRRLLTTPATYGIVKAGEYLAVGVPMVRGGDIKEGSVNVDLPLVSREVHEQYDRTRLSQNDVVIALVGSPGEAAVIPDVLIGANISRAVGLLRVAPQLDPHYLAVYLNSPAGRANVLKPSAGSAQTVVNLSDLNALQIPLPAKEEQERIAGCIAALDAGLAQHLRRLEGLKRHKQGLLQQLFPTPEEETR